MFKTNWYNHFQHSNRQSTIRLFSIYKTNIQVYELRHLNTINNNTCSNSYIPLFNKYKTILLLKEADWLSFYHNLFYKKALSK